MAEARQPVLQALQAKLASLNSNFSREKETFREILVSLDSCLRLRVCTESDLIEWLEGLIDQEKLYIVHGFLAILYFRYGPVEEGRPHLDQAQEMFPDKVFWIQTMLDEVWAEFESGNDSLPC